MSTGRFGASRQYTFKRLEPLRNPSSKKQSGGGGGALGVVEANIEGVVRAWVEEIHQTIPHRLESAQCPGGRSQRLALRVLTLDTISQAQLSKAFVNVVDMDDATIA